MSEWSTEADSPLVSPDELVAAVYAEQQDQLPARGPLRPAAAPGTVTIEDVTDEPYTKEVSQRVVVDWRRAYFEFSEREYESKTIVPFDEPHPQWSDRGIEGFSGYLKYYHELDCKERDCDDCDAGGTRCSECRGNRTVVCSNCLDGHVETGPREDDFETCPECGGSNQRVCPQCSGDGYTTCSTCDGTDTIFEWTGVVRSYEPDSTTTYDSLWGTDWTPAEYDGTLFDWEEAGERIEHHDPGLPAEETDDRQESVPLYEEIRTYTVPSRRVEYSVDGETYVVRQLGSYVGIADSPTAYDHLRLLTLPSFTELHAELEDDSESDAADLPETPVPTIRHVALGIPLGIGYLYSVSAAFNEQLLFGVVSAGLLLVGVRFYRVGKVAFATSAVALAGLAYLDGGAVTQSGTLGGLLVPGLLCAIPLITVILWGRYRVAKRYRSELSISGFNEVAR